MTLMIVYLLFIINNSNAAVKTQAIMKQQIIEITQRAPIGSQWPTSKTKPEKAQRRKRVVTFTIPLPNQPKYA